MDLSTTYGSATISSFLGAGLFGFTFLQTYTYFIHKSVHDHVAMKCGVFLLWILDCLQAVFLVWTVYWYLVQNFFNPTALGSVHWPLTLTWMMSGLGCLITEFYFVPQIWRMSKGIRPVVIVIAICTLGQFASTLTTFIRTSEQLDIINPELTVQMGPTLISQQVFASISNSLISICLIWYKRKENGSLFGNQGWFEGLLTIAIDYATIAAIFQWIYLIIYLIYPLTYLSLPYQVATGKLLVNALLAQLNARDMDKMGASKRAGAANIGYHLSHLSRPIDVNVPMDGLNGKATLETDSHSLQSIKHDLERQDPKH